MSKGTLSRRTPRGWEVIRRLDDDNQAHQPANATIIFPEPQPKNKRFNILLVLAVIFTASIFISAFVFVRGRGETKNARVVFSAPAPVIGVVREDAAQYFYMQNGRAFALTADGAKENPELNFKLLDDESMVWISSNSNHFITARQNRLSVYRLGADEQLIKLTELDGFSAPADESGIMVGGQEIISADLIRHEKIMTDDQLVSGSCKLNLCAVNGQRRVYLKRADETIWSAISPAQSAPQAPPPASYIVNGNAVLIAGDDSFDLYEQNDNRQWVKTKQWKREIFGIENPAEVVWIGQSSPISEPVILMKYFDSARYFYIELGTLKCENLSGVKTSLSKIIWLKNNTLNLFDRDGNLYQHEINSEEEAK